MNHQKLKKNSQSDSIHQYINQKYKKTFYNNLVMATISHQGTMHSPLKAEIFQTDLQNQLDSLVTYSENYQEKPSSNKARQNSKLSKQNKDGANAARTARITIITFILNNFQKQFLFSLHMIKQSVDIKKLMLNIGERQFKRRFMFKPELKQFFSEVFQIINEKHIYKLMRINKRSQLDLQKRISLCYKYIEQYKEQFGRHFEHPKVIIPIPLKPKQYDQYMSKKILSNQ